MKKISPVQKVLNIWALILIVWSIYRTKFFFPEWLDEFIIKPLIFVGPVWFYISRIEKKPFFADIWLRTTKILPDIYLSLGVAVLFSVSAMASNLIKYGSIQLSTLSIFSDPGRLVMLFFLSLATAASEEILSRGFILKRLYEDSNNILTASFNASVLFFILHIPILFSNIKLTGGLLLFFMITNLLLSFANSIIFITRKSLILPILIHAFYNLTIILYV